MEMWIFSDTRILVMSFLSGLGSDLSAVSQYRGANRKTGRLDKGHRDTHFRSGIVQPAHIIADENNNHSSSHHTVLNPNQK